MKVYNKQKNNRHGEREMGIEKREMGIDKKSRKGHSAGEDDNWVNIVLH